jgi:hypothetical protein
MQLVCRDRTCIAALEAFPDKAVGPGQQVQESK